jgi:hypothetical protein
MILKVKTWLLTVEIGPNSTRKIEVLAPTRRLALLNLRFGEEYRGYNYLPVLKIGLKRS